MFFNKTAPMRNEMNESKIACRSSVFRAYIRSLQLCATAVLFALSTVPSLSANEPAKPDEVGRVTLVIGQALAHNKNGENRPLKRGDAVYVAETIETSEGGHLHLRFVDEGTVSLRPNSRLSIELYHYDQQQPQNSAIRFKLEAGVVRSISGKATQAAHDRFRLNTPITAIGVLGTDFAVRAEPEKMWAGVYSGAIAIAPLGEQCPVNGLGACGGATRLSEAMGSVMIEFSGRREKEKVLPLDSTLLSKAGGSGGETQSNSEGSSSAAPGRITVAEMKVTDVLSAGGTPQTQPQPQMQMQTQSAAQQPSPFAWARWGSQLPGDAISKPFLDAQQGRTITVGNRYFGLFSAFPTSSELEPRTGAYDFKLAQGQVYFVGNGVSWLPQQSTLARLDAASLHIDFAQRQFNTHLEMSYPQAGSAALDLTGPIQDNGIFFAQNPGGRAAGTLSPEGGNAGMFFEREIQAGTFHGITDWTKK
jgi:hypothetical protein